MRGAELYCSTLGDPIGHDTLNAARLKLGLPLLAFDDKKPTPDPKKQRELLSLVIDVRLGSLDSRYGCTRSFPSHIRD